MTIRIGLPRGLLYYQYGTIWERFLKELGAEVVVTRRTTKETLDYGSALDEVCLPVKAYFGHVYELYQQVDYLFIPRVISVAAGQYTCPKIIGLPDLLRSNIANLPPVIDVNINLRQNRRNLYRAITNIGHALDKGAIASIYAWHCACTSQRQPRPICLKNSRQRVGLIGHPYIIFDHQISMHVIDKLHDLGVDVVTSDLVSNRQAAACAKTFGKKIFWSNSSHLAGSALVMMQSAQPVDGLIFITSFSCGQDALVGELIKQRASFLNIPHMLLTVDEHTAEAGFETRLEAFTDMLLRRKKS